MRDPATRQRNGAGLIISAAIALSLALSGFLVAVVGVANAQHPTVVAIAVLALIVGDVLAAVVIVLAIVHLVRGGRRTAGGIAIAFGLLALLGTAVGVIALAIVASAALLSVIAIFLAWVSAWMISGFFG